MNKLTKALLLVPVFTVFSMAASAKTIDCYAEGRNATDHFYCDGGNEGNLVLDNPGDAVIIHLQYDTTFVPGYSFFAVFTPDDPNRDPDLCPDGSKDCSSKFTSTSNSQTHELKPGQSVGSVTAYKPGGDEEVLEFTDRVNNENGQVVFKFGKK